MENLNEIRQREQIPVEDTWAVEDLYPTDVAWREDLAALAAEKEKLVSYSGHLKEMVAEMGEEFADYHDDLEKAFTDLSENVMKEFSYEIKEIEKEDDDEYKVSIDIVCADDESADMEEKLNESMGEEVVQEIIATALENGDITAESIEKI